MQIFEVHKMYSFSADTSLLVYYTGCKYQDLRIIQIFWEVSKQHITIYQTLSKVKDDHVEAMCDLYGEEQKCITRLEGL